MSAGERCSLCGVEYSPVWRKDRETQGRVCNRCYCKRRPDFAKKSAQGKPGHVNGVKEGGKRVKRKSQDSGGPIGGEASSLEPALEDLSTPAVDTDSEYPEVDANDGPSKIVVKASGSQKIDGAYVRLSRSSRGKPCYVKWVDKKPMYLFWNKKWYIGWEFGSTKSYAFVKDAGMLSPCEPYPKAWKVCEKKEKHVLALADDADQDSRKYVVNLAMRVMDAATMQVALEEEAVEFAPPSEGFSSSRRKRTRALALLPRVQEAAKDPDASQASSKGGVDEIGPPDSADEKSEGSQSCPSSDEDSDSNSSESSSSPSVVEHREPVKAEVTEVTGKKETLAAKAISFEDKLREQLSKVTDVQARRGKFETVRKMLLQKLAGKEQVAGLSPERIRSLLDGLERWVLEQEAAAAAAALIAGRQQARSSSAPPPPPPQPYLLANGTSSPRQTMPRSCLRKPGAQRNTRRRITYMNDDMLVNQVFVTSHRDAGEQLWFVQPGAVVSCDSCNEEVLQSMGSLQGAPNQSQFAQFKFLCSECSGF